MGKSINKETRGASVKKIVCKPDVNGGLALVVLSDVDVANAEIKQDSSYVEFRGMEVPRLTFVFTEKVIGNEEAGMYFKSYMPNPEIFNSDNEWKWDTMAQTMKHFIDVLSEDNFKDEYADLLNLPMDEGKEYTAEEQIAAWATFFKGVQKVFKGNKKEGLPVLLNKITWAKLLLDIKGTKVNGGDFGMSNYPGDGLIELYKEGTAPSLRINIAKGESIVPRVYEEPTKLGAPTADASGTAPGERPDFMK